MTDPRRLDIVAAAKGEVGPGDLDKYWGSCGIYPTPDPHTKSGYWCGAFALWALHAAHVAEKTKWLIGLGFIYPLRLPRTKNPQPGDIMYVDHPWQHHGIVVELKNGILWTVEGNTPDVKLRSRPFPKEGIPGITFYSIAPLLGEKAAHEEEPHATVPAPAPHLVEPADKDSLIKGLDVAHHQAPSRINWVAAAKTYKFCIARAAYGDRPDETCVDHIRRARDVGMKTGLYLFYRPQFDVGEQLAAFDEIVDAVSFGPGWLPPVIDIEPNVKYDGQYTGARYAHAEAITQTWRERWGSAFVYTSKLNWEALKNPEWLKTCYLWLANYNHVADPATPLGLPWVIWQHRVSVLPGIYQSELDQNLARALPLLQEKPIPFFDLDPDWDTMRRKRDEMIRDDDNGG